jgi:Holliday junction resolvase RusA-like endonuclease
MSKLSIGQCFSNDQPFEKLEIKAFELDHSKRIYVFDIIPMGAVRQTQADKWKNRPEVVRYRNFKNTLQDQAKQMNFICGETINMIFCVPMPISWSEKKRNENNKMPCKTRPDIDNYVKGFMDALLIEDGFVWKITAEKRYAFQGSIIVYK